MVPTGPKVGIKEVIVAVHRGLPPTAKQPGQASCFSSGPKVNSKWYEFTYSLWNNCPKYNFILFGQMSNELNATMSIFIFIT